MNRKKGVSLRIKSFIVIIIMAVALCIAAAALSASSFHNTNDKLFKSHSEDIAAAAAANL